MWQRVVLWLFVINLGIAFGAGIYEARVVIPAWKDIPPGQWPNTGILFWVYVTTVPLTLLTLASLFAAWSLRGPMRKWYLTAVAFVIVERAATFSYFIPNMVRLMGAEGVSEDQIDAGLSQWLLVNHGRHILTLCGWVAALRALSLSGRPNA